MLPSFNLASKAPFCLTFLHPLLKGEGNEIISTHLCVRQWLARQLHGITQEWNFFFLKSIILWLRNDLLASHQAQEWLFVTSLSISYLDNCPSFSHTQVGWFHKQQTIPSDIMLKPYRRAGKCETEGGHLLITWSDSRNQGLISKQCVKEPLFD